MPEPVLALEAVTLLAPEGRPVFHGLDWQLQRGARFHVPTGAGVGCTALLRLCAGIAAPDRGRVLLDGLAMDLEAQHPFLARGALGWVPSDGGLAMNLSLLANVALPLRFALGQGRREAEASARDWLERAGLGPKAEQRPGQPAGSDNWLAALARAAARNCRLWLVDRPAGGLDGAAIQAAEAILRDAARDPDVTMLLVGGDWMAGLGLELKIAGGRVFSGREP